MSRTIEVDTRTFVRFWLVLLGVVLVGIFIWRALTGLIIVGIAAFLAIAIQPLAQKINRLMKVDRTAFSSALAYVLIIGVIALILAIVAPVVVEQTAQFVQQLPETFEKTLGGWDGINDFGRGFGVENLQDQIVAALETFSSSFMSDVSGLVVSSVGAVAQVVTGVVLTLVLTLLFSLEGPSIIAQFWKLLEGKSKNAPVQAWKRLAGRMAGVIGTYVSKQVMVAVLDGCVTLIAILLLSLTCGFDGGLAVPMGMIAMVFYLIPMFGPIISCILIPLLLLFSSPVAAVIFLVFYIIYEQIENNLIAPKIQGDALNLPTAIILVAITIGMYMFGLVGAIVAIPIAGCVKVIFEELPNLREAGV